MAHFYFILVALLAFAAIVQAFIDIGVLEPCDDCCSPVNALPKPIRMGGVLYGAFAVSVADSSQTACVQFLQANLIVL